MAKTSKLARNAQRKELVARHALKRAALKAIINSPKSTQETKLTGVNVTLSSAQFHKGSAAHDTSDRIIYNSANGALLYDADGNTAGGAAAIQFATLSAGLAITRSDFFIV